MNRLAPQRRGIDLAEVPLPTVPPPAGLDGQALGLWWQIAPGLRARGLLDRPSDIELFAVTCLWFEVCMLAVPFRQHAAWRRILALALRGFRLSGRRFGLRTPYRIKEAIIQ